MKILHIILTMSPRHGGSTTVLKSLAHEQAHSGHEVTVCTTNKDSLKGEMDLFTGVPIIDDNYTIWYYQAQFASLSFSIELGSWLKKSVTCFDIIHIHGIYRFPMVYGAWCARRSGVPYLITLHGNLDPFLYKQSRYNLILKRIYEHLFAFPSLNHASAIHYTAKEEMERTSFLKLRAPAVILPNGINWELYENLPSRGYFQKRIGLSDKIPLVLFLGRINFTKGLDLLVQSFARVLDKFSDAFLAIVGPDNEGYCQKVKQWCREQGVEDKVIFVDHLGPEEVKQAYVDADVFVLPSYTENFGMTVVEAMACECPVVISDQVNIWREIREEGAGLVVGLDPVLIADTICRILGDKKAADEMGKRGRKAVKRRYTWPHIVEQLTQIYQKLIEENEAK